MKPRSLIAVSFGLMLLAASLPARAALFTSDTLINAFDPTYDGEEIVVSNCTLTVNGPHGFSNLLVAAGGTLTHTFSPTGTVSVPRLFPYEAQVLISTNPVSLVNTGAFVLGEVTDLAKTVIYTNYQDYAFTFPGNGLIQLQRTTNSTISDGATVLVTYLVHWFADAGLNLSVTGNVEIATGGMIDVNGKGFGGNLGTGGGGEFLGTPNSGGGAGHGGYGGLSSSNGVGGTVYGSFTQPVTLGSGGGYGVGGSSSVGGPGGGAVKIVATGDLILNGVIGANGADATNSRSGGGSGGSIWLSGQMITGAGAITANGGAGEPIHGGGAGGGRIALEAKTTNSFSGPITAYGGMGAKIGGAGTIYTKLTGQNGFLQSGSLLIDNGNQAGTNTLLQVTNGADVAVRGRAVGVTSAAQSIGKLLVGSNSWITAFNVNSTVNITSGDTTIESGGKITADGLGTQFGPGAGIGVSGGFPIYFCGGGGHGGYGGTGGNVNARGGGSFDSTATPTSFGGPGGGSGSSFSPFGGMGGGAVRMIVSGQLVLNGSISADGKMGSGSYAGGGAGGSVWLTLANWSGSGAVSANGGAGVLPGGGGGGGGRVSISFDSNSFAGTITAYGGIGTNTGGAGTIYLKTNSQSIAQLILDNGGNAGTNTTFDAPSFPFVDFIVSGKAVAQLSGNLNTRNFQIRSNSTVISTFAISPITISASGNGTIETGAILSVDGMGYSIGGPGLGITGSVNGGGGHGGYGGANPGLGSQGSAYDSITSPSMSGSSGGGSSPPYGGAGGGALMFNVNGTLTVNGRISANGRNPETIAGGGSGGTVNIHCGPLAGSGVVSANGGAGLGNSGGGGGGRIAITYSSNGFSGTLTAVGGTGIAAGGAGTIYTKLNLAPVGDLIVSNGGLIGTNTPLSGSFSLPPAAFNLMISGGASIAVLTPLPLLRSLTIGANSALTAQSSLTVSVISNLTIAASGAITMDGKGFARGTGPGAGGSVANKGAGGGYGGIGGASASGALGGTNYGSATQPVDSGSGGGAGANAFFGGCDGGGAVRLTVAGTLTLDGALSANGNPGLQDDSGGGSGGSIWVVANTMSGNGIISANGGPGDLFGGGGGGGGRIAINVRSNTFTGTSSVAGGGGATVGGVGSLVWSNLPLVQGTVTDTNGQPVPGVLLSASIGNSSATTGLDGKYELGVVPYTSFTVAPSFSGFVFVPGSRSYSASFASATNQNYLMAATTAATMTSSLQNTNLALKWFGLAGISYQLYYSIDLINWVPYDVPIDGSNAVVELLVPIMDDSPKKFFRVQGSY